MTGQLPFVSILMTAFNREKLIPYAIESVLSSTYNNFELIIVDDASADATVNIAQSYASKDDRIKIYVNEKNLGDYPNRNKAASYAKGKYLKYLDSDDYIYPNGLEIMVCSMERFPDAGFGLCSLKPDAEKPYPFLLNPKESYQYHFLGPGLFHKGPLTAIFLRSAFEELRGFKEGRMVSDTDMWHRMALKYPVVLMQDGIVWQRIHGKQELADSHNFIVAGAKIKWSYLLEPDCPLTRTQVKLIRRRRLKRYAGFVVSGLKHFNFKQAGTYLKCLFFTLRIRV
ncbi:MAG: glycosyltransferase family 2 protein [Ginsengibacter sp.]